MKIQSCGYAHTHISVNFVCVCARARARVRVHASGDIESMAHENAVLKESLVNLEEQLEMAERKMDASMKIVEKVQQVCPI